MPLAKARALLLPCAFLAGALILASSCASSSGVARVRPSSQVAEQPAQSRVETTSRPSAQADRLLDAAEKDDLDALCAALDAESNLNAQSDRIGAALMLAALNEPADAVRALADAGTALNAQNNNGWTALIYAAQNGQPQAVQALT